MSKQLAWHLFRMFPHHLADPLINNISYPIGQCSLKLVEHAALYNVMCAVLRSTSNCQYLCSAINHRDSNTYNGHIALSNHM